MIVCPSLNLAESDKDELPLLEGNWKLITEECTKTEETADLVWLFQAMQTAVGYWKIPPWLSNEVTLSPWHPQEYELFGRNHYM